MPGVIKTIVNEPDFEITIYEWNDRTIQFLKIIADDKCNNNDKKNKTPDEPYTPEQKKTENTNQTEEEQKKPDETETKKIRIFQYKVKKEDVLTIDGNVKIYKQVEEYLEKHLPDDFTRKDMIDKLIKAWEELFNEKLAYGSAKTYWPKYKRYMVKQGLIEEDEKCCYHKIKKDEEWIEEDDDSDDGKDHCYLPEWTNKELDVLEKNIFSFPTKKEAIELVAKKLDKTEDEVRVKAKKRGMILR